MPRRLLFTSESVTEGHPDKVADQISDAVLDAILAKDPHARVACETMVTTGIATIFGEITTTTYVPMPKIVRETIQRIGYTDASYGFDHITCAVMTSIDEQSRDIGQGVDVGGAGDQGMMFGYASDETPELMPLPIALAHGLTRTLAARRKDGTLPWLRPDGKSQVTVVYEDGVAVAVDTVVISTQHADGVSNEEIHAGIIKHVIEPVVPAAMRTGKINYHINPTGRFVVGGPQGDAGLTGRKIIVAAKLANRVEVQLAYAIGVAEPVSVYVDSFGTGVVADDVLEQAVRSVFRLTPAAIIEDLELKKPIYSETAAYGHFGRSPETVERHGQKVTLFTWERTDRAAALRKAAGLTV
jgi:S-adenosylmethionine synthetase